jgi:hypothetical protein
LDAVSGAADLSTLLAAEAEAASLYWHAWSALPVPIVSRDPARIPEHWLTFGQRASLITGGPRTATRCLRPRPRSPATLLGWTRSSGSSTPTNARAPRWPSTRWKPCGRSWMPTFWPCSPSANSPGRTSLRPGKATVA